MAAAKKRYSVTLNQSWLKDTLDELESISDTINGIGTAEKVVIDMPIGRDQTCTATYDHHEWDITVEGEV